MFDVDCFDDDFPFLMEEEEDFDKDVNLEVLLKHRVQQHPDCDDPLHPGCERCLIGDAPSLFAFDHNSVLENYL